MKKPVRVELKISNNLILSRMEEAGIDSVAELCELIDVPVSTVYSLISMKLPARQKDGQWRDAAIKLSDFFLCLPEDLFTQEQQDKALETNRAVAEVNFAEVQQLTAGVIQSVTPELLAQARDTKLVIKRVLHSLTPREQSVLMLRFGFVGNSEWTLEQVAGRFDIGVDRIRRIEAIALRKLGQHPYADKLVKVAGFKTGKGRYRIDQDVMDALLVS